MTIIQIKLTVQTIIMEAATQTVALMEDTEQEVAVAQAEEEIVNEVTDLIFPLTVPAPDVDMEDNQEDTEIATTRDIPE